MWEVGVRLCVGHMGDPCPSQEVLNDECIALEQRKDQADRISIEQFHYGPLPDAGDGVNPPNVRTEDPVVDEDNEDPEWEDVPPVSPDVPLRTATPSSDEFDNQFLLIVDSSGLTSLPAIWCRCDHVKGQEDQLLLDLQMFPASYDDIRTVFTFQCLDDFRASNLECKTSAYQYFQRLRRLTNPAFPQSVPNRYGEFRRVSRQWRNIKLRKWFGFGHRLLQPSRGSLALFCAACPQPGVNLPADFQTRYTE